MTTTIKETTIVFDWDEQIEARRYIAAVTRACFAKNFTFSRFETFTIPTQTATTIDQQFSGEYKPPKQATQELAVFVNEVQAKFVGEYAPISTCEYVLVMLRTGPGAGPNIIAELIPRSYIARHLATQAQANDLRQSRNAQTPPETHP